MTTETITLRDGYDRTKHPTVRTFRPMTPAEAVTVTNPIYFESRDRMGRFDGTYRQCRRNGAAKTWKTRDDVELPIKYGLRERARAVSRNGEMVLPSGGRLLVPVAAMTADELEAVTTRT